MKIIWHSVPSEFKTGYGVLTKLFTSRLKKLGLEVLINPVLAGIQDHVNSDGIQTLATSPISNDYGCRWLPEHCDYHQPDIVLSGTDCFVYDVQALQKIPNWSNWVVIDSTPLNPVIAERLDFAKHILAPTRFAQNVLSAVGYESDYVPYGIDPACYYPVPKAEARESLSSEFGVDLKDKFFVSTVGANSKSLGRKNFEMMFEIWGEFIKTHPDAILYVHACLTDEFGGVRLYRLQKFFNIPQKNIMYAPQYAYKAGLIDENFLRTVLSASDCYFQPTKGEGFGLPVVEAQRCGAPLVATKCSTMPELCFGGILVDGTPQMTNFETYWVNIDKGDAIDALDEMYQRKDEQELRDQAVEGAKFYDIDNVMDNYMMPMLKKMAGED